MSREPTFLSPKHWFEKGHDIHGWEKFPENRWHPVIKKDVNVWSPPSVAAERAIEQLRIARHKRQQSVHLFLCPRLFTSQWRSHLHKSADVIFEIPPVVEFWGSDMHEPIVVGVYLSSFEQQPWFFKGTAWVERLEKNLRDTFKDGKDDVSLLKTLLETSEAIPNYSAQNLKQLLLE